MSFKATAQLALFYAAAVASLLSAECRLSLVVIALARTIRLSVSYIE